MAQQKAVEAPAVDVEDLVDELQPGTKLLKGQYTIVRYINSGGFGITYLAKDSLDRDVVIKECFPSSVCRRSKAVVAARSRAHSAELRSVVQLFVREARHLSKIVHPNIVAVHQVFEDNGTAYMAIDFIDGLDLQQIIEGQGHMPNPDEIVVMTEKLLAAVGFIHANDMLHRDISPDNVLIDNKGEPTLIDFGAAREQASQKSRAMSALRVVKDGYSPQEFYIAGSEQGPWSDLYALGATLYHLIVGEAPLNGQARLAALAEEKPDPYTPLDGRYDGYPPGFLAAIDKALSTLPKQRVQSAQEWMSMFKPGQALPGAKTDDIEAAVLAMVANSKAEVAAPAPFGAPPQLARPVSQPKPSVQVQDTVPQARIAGRSGLPVQMFGGIVAALALVGVGIMLLGKEDAPPAAASETVAPVETADTPAIPDVAAAGVTETAAALPEPAPAAVEPEVAASPDPVVEPPVVAETAPAVEEPAETVAVEPAADAPAAVETAAVEPVAEEPAVAEAAADPEAAPAALPQDNQVGFAAWDVEMPFVEDSRIIGGKRVAIILRILPTVDVAEVGDWMADGLILYSVNGVDIQQSGNATTAVLNAMRVDPDGKSRVVVEYAGSSLERQTGLMTVQATRLLNLVNGVNVTTSAIEGEWKSVVTAVNEAENTTLQVGDTLFRDKTTGVALDGPNTLETILAQLVQSGASMTEFSIVRSNKVATASMKLAVKDAE